MIADNNKDPLLQLTCSPGALLSPRAPRLQDPYQGGIAPGKGARYTETFATEGWTE